MYLARNPLCVVCGRLGRVRAATEVHHVKPIAEGGSDADENLMALCTPCHSRITRQANAMPSHHANGVPNRKIALNVGV